VLASAAISLAAADRGGLEYAAPLPANLLLVFVATALLGERREFDFGSGVIFAFLIATIIWFYDAFRPVYDRRFA
jgi:hypothetical protein